MILREYIDFDVIFAHGEIFEGRHLMKIVTMPIKQVVPKRHLRGLKDDFGDVLEDVLLLEGETHLPQEPVPVSLEA